MKPIKTTTFILVILVFLVAVQILFFIPAPYNFLDAAWGAGDLLTFVGTITLGLVAYKQSEQINKVSRGFIELQAEEYTPIIIATDLLGISKFKFNPASELISTDISITEMRTDENELFFGYALLINDYNFDQNQATDCRSYEIHLKYISKSVLTTLTISTVSFTLGKKIVRFSVNKSIDRSLQNGQSFIFYIYIISNSNFLDSNSNAHFYIKSTKMEIAFDFKTVAGENSKGILEIQKHFTVEGDKILDDKNTERFISSSYKKIEDN